MNSLQPRSLLRIGVLCFVSTAAYSQERVRIAVSPFLDRSGQITSTTSAAEMNTRGGAQSESSVSSKGDLGGQVADAVITELVKLGAFDVVERIQLEKVIAEQKLSMADLDETAQASEAARLLGAQLLVTGSITEAAVARTGRGFVVVKKKELIGRVVIDTRLIDIQTTMAVWGTTTEGIETLQSQQIMGVGRDDMAGAEMLLGRAARQAADDLVLQLVPVIDQFGGNPQSGTTGLTAGVTLREGLLYLSVGSKVGVTVGDQFALYVLGEPFEVGGKMIQDEIQVGTVQVTDVFPEYSRGPAPASVTGLTPMTLETLTARRVHQQGRGTPH